MLFHLNLSLKKNSQAAKDKFIIKSVKLIDLTGRIGILDKEQELLKALLSKGFLNINEFRQKEKKLRSEISLLKKELDNELLFIQAKAELKEVLDNIKTLMDSGRLNEKEGMENQQKLIKHKVEKIKKLNYYFRAYNNCVTLKSGSKHISIVFAITLLIFILNAIAYDKYF